jgi:hypothetical protein
LIVKPETSHVESSRPVVTFHASHPKSVRWPDKSPSLRHQRNGILISISLDLFWISDQLELEPFYVSVILYNSLLPPTSCVALFCSSLAHGWLLWCGCLDFQAASKEPVCGLSHSNE